MQENFQQIEQTWVDLESLVTVNDGDVFLIQNRGPGILMTLESYTTPDDEESTAGTLIPADISKQGVFIKGTQKLFLKALTNASCAINITKANNNSGGQTINNQDITVTANGVYTAESGYTGLGTVTVNVPSPVETVTATNNSSYDRVNGEKVWLSKSGDNYSIINYASADKNSLIGACKQNIAIGASGSVETLDEGVLVPHLTRDFVLNSGITESNIDDAAGLLTIPLSTASAFIVSNVIDMPSTAETDFKFKIKFKYINNDSGTTPTLPLYTLGGLNFNDSISYPSGYEPQLYTSGNDIGGSYPRSSNARRTLTYNATGVLNIDDWLTVSIETNSTSPYATLKIVDTNGNTYTKTDTDFSCTFNSHNVQRVCIGQSSSYPSTLSAVFDLSECGLFSADESVTYWTPYTETEG